MPSIINATTTNGVVTSGDNSGALVIATNNNVAAITIGTNQVATFAQQPAGTFAGTGPAFSAYQSTQQTGVSAGTFTLVNLQTEEFDTASRFNNTGSTSGGIPAYAFLPDVAGYYQVNGTVWCISPPATTTMIQGFTNLWKNGSWFKDGSFHVTAGNAQNELGSMFSTLVYLNGSTDYIQMYIWANTTSGTSNIYGSFQQQRVHFSASLVRAA
jgi:hypothetical protein